MSFVPTFCDIQQKICVNKFNYYVVNQEILFRLIINLNRNLM